MLLIFTNVYLTETKASPDTLIKLARNVYKVAPLIRTLMISLSSHLSHQNIESKVMHVRLLKALR